MKRKRPRAAGSQPVPAPAAPLHVSSLAEVLAKARTWYHGPASSEPTA